MSIVADKLNPDHTIARPEQIKAMALLLKTGLEAIVTKKGVESIDPLVAVLCYDCIKGDYETRLHGIFTGFSTSMEKKIGMKTVAASVYMDRLFPVCVGLVSEAWVAHTPNEEAYEEHKKKYLMIADDPNRKEVAIIAIQGFFRDGDNPPLSFHDLRYMARGKGNRVVWEGDWLNTADEGGSMDSALMDHFYRGYVGFASKREDPESYLHGRKVVKLDEHIDRDS